MLDITEDAAELIVQLVAAAELPPGAGLRIAQRDDHPALAMSLAAAGPEDRQVPSDQAVVFLAPVAAARLEGQTLNARSGETGAAFYVRD